MNFYPSLYKVVESKKNYVRWPLVSMHTLESGIDVGQGINVGPGKFVKKNVGP